MTDQGTPAKSKGGRPRVPEPGVAVYTWLRPKDYDKIVLAAKSRDTSVSALVRCWLRRNLTP